MWRCEYHLPTDTAPLRPTCRAPSDNPEVFFRSGLQTFPADPQAERICGNRRCSDALPRARLLDRPSDFRLALSLVLPPLAPPRGKLASVARLAKDTPAQ